IAGDRDMLRTVLIALISNGIKFQQKDVPPVITVGFDRMRTQWSITVTDNGIGVDEAFAPKMFGMFSRFHPVGEYSGAGVGLALSKRIIDCHSGKLTVQANPSGQGTTFTISVPILSKDEKSSLETSR